jgi:hypothetical protein
MVEKTRGRKERKRKKRNRVRMRIYVLDIKREKTRGLYASDIDSYTLPHTSVSSSSSSLLLQVGQRIAGARDVILFYKYK